MKDFKTVADNLLSRAMDLLPLWLPGGKLVGKEYETSDISGGPGNSLKVNTQTGKWKDFATGQDGGDLISLYAEIHHMNNGQALRNLTEQGYGSNLPATTTQELPENDIIKPPIDAEPPNFIHYKHGEPTTVWTYLGEFGEIIYHIARYDSADGKKHFSPWSWSKSRNSWVQKQQSKPRPLYGLYELAQNPDKRVIIVEGEKSADAVRAMNLNLYVVVTWSGGAQAIKDTDLTPLFGRTILIWPDHDEPGFKAAATLANILVHHCPEVKIISTKDQDLDDGWDAADSNFTSAQFYAWAKPLAIQVHKPEIMQTNVHNDDVPMPTSEDQPPTIGTVDVSERASASAATLYKRYDLTTNTKGIADCNANNVLRILMNHDEFKFLVWYDEFHGSFFTGDKSKPRQWNENDDVMLTVKLQSLFEMKKLNKNTVIDAVMAYGRINTVNEPKDYLLSLEWDKNPRINDFFINAMGVAETEFARAVGHNFWVGMVARVLTPGCKVDEMVILEGLQGTYKSTALSIIGGKWYAKVSSDLASKDFVQALQGKMLMEMDELDRFGKADDTTIKMILSTQTDRYRASYGRYTNDYPRTCIFVGSTNEDTYLKDATGGRRFWPLKIKSADLDYIRTNRDQLFAEAVYRFKAGDNWYEVPETAKAEQLARYRSDPWEPLIADHFSVYKEHTIVGIATSLGITIDKLDDRVQKRIANVCKTLGFTRHNLRRDGKQQKMWVKDYDAGNDVLPATPARPNVPNFAPNFDNL